ncbi:MAG: hypothetical protein AAFQ42_05010 [Pseudomonadota bacterium]
MARRLLDTMSRQLDEIERGFETGEIVSVSDRERQARLMNTIARSMEKLTEFEEQDERRRAAEKKRGTAGEPGEPRDAETRRHELARRIDRLRAAWIAEGRTSDDRIN